MMFTKPLKIIKVIWHDPVLSKVIATVLVGILGVAYLSWNDFRTLIQNFGNKIWEYCITIWQLCQMPITLPVGIVVIMGVLALPVLIVIFELLRQHLIKKPSTSSPQNSWENYTTDVFFGLKWQWRYSGNQVKGLISLCKECNYQVYPQSQGFYNSYQAKTEYFCDSCDKITASLDSPSDATCDKVERLIHKNIRNNEY